MAHTITLRRIDALRSQPEPLAYDIESLEVASRLAQGIANSYPTHGHDEARGAFWFINRTFDPHARIERMCMFSARRESFQLQPNTGISVSWAMDRVSNRYFSVLKHTV